MVPAGRQWRASANMRAIKRFDIGAMVQMKTDERAGRLCPALVVRELGLGLSSEPIAVRSGAQTAISFLPAMTPRTDRRELRRGSADRAVEPQVFDC